MPSATRHYKAVQATEALNAIIESLPTAMVMTDEQGAIVQANSEADSLLGCERRELLGRTLEALLPEHCRAEYSELHNRTFTAPQSRPRSERRELFLVRKDSGEVPVDISLKPIETEQGRFVLGVITDTTQRTRLETALVRANEHLSERVEQRTAQMARQLEELQAREEALRESEERFRLLVEGAHGYAIFMLDPEGRVRTWNAGAQRITGYTADEIIGQHFFRLHTPETAAAGHPRRELETAAREGRHEEDGWRVRKDGSRFIAHVLITALRDGDGRLQGYANITRDITERKESEALRNSEERLRLIVDRALDAVVTINERGLVTRWNPQAEIVFGWRAEEAINAVLADLIIPPQYRQAHHAGLARFLECGEGPMLHKRMELNALHKEGRTFPVELAIAPIRLGDHYEFSAFVRDITERKQWEIALRDTNERLEKRVEERTAQLAHQSAQLSQANEALTRSNLDLQQFAYVASHDLQAPLRGISGFVQALQAEYEGQLDKQADEWIARTLQATKRAQSLIQDLLTFSRVDSRARPFEQIRFGEVLDDAVTGLEESIRESGAQITRGELPTVMGDRAQLVQLMHHLLANALTFHDATPPQVEVRAEHEGEAWHICVRDNGIGIDPKHHERIFEIFQRLHDQQRYPGAGMGLAICRRIVHRHGGRIWVDSKPERGSTFHFTLPDARLLP